MRRIFLIFWESFKEYIVLVVLIVVSLTALSFNQNKAVKNVRAAAFGTFALVTSVVSDFINVAKIKNENEHLAEMNAELMLQINQLRQYGIENRELKSLINLKDSTDYPLIPATIVSKSLTGAQNSLTLNVGTNAGVRPGMPVITDKGLTGIVFSVSDDYSIIRTLKNQNLKLTVKNERSRINAVMKWNGEYLVMINVPKTYDVQPGDRIITSELSSIVPIPIPVGVVVKLNNVERGIFNEVIVKPFVDFIRIEHVFILGIVESRQKNNLELNFYNRK
ncbi:MAG: rod shape-determining protein MreC [Ignavibacteriaceae bacterium]|nr:rod shape-determining protein MreC [Ignavibacteriaceae bacterium]